MSTSNFLGVIRSDERSEESKDPFGRQQFQIDCCAKWTRGDFSQL
jgi:hypothetical protein